MRIGRTLPPAAAPIPWGTIIRALPACISPKENDNVFEQEIKEEFTVKYCSLLSSGKAALTLIFQALHNKNPGRTCVLIPAFTCFSVPAAIKSAGLQVKLCDTAPNSLGFDENQLQKLIEIDKKEKSILCVLVTHLFGCPMEIDVIRKLVRLQFPIVEDAAQAMGETINDGKIGTLGDVGFFSLGRGKALSAMEGGIVVTNRTDLGEELIRLTQNCKSYSVGATCVLALKTIMTTLLQHPRMFWIPKAIPILRLGDTLYEECFAIKKISFFQRKLLRNWKDRLRGHRKRRLQNMNLWRDTSALMATLVCSDNPSVALVRMPALLRNKIERDAIVIKSEEKGYGVMAVYPCPINEIDQIKEEFTGQSYPNAKHLSNCLLTVPVHEYVRVEDIY